MKSRRRSVRSSAGASRGGAAAAGFDEDNVFLNVPYDRGYEPLFVTAVATLVGLGLKPRTVLELPETGQGRLGRIQAHLEACRVSVHDLSRVGTPVRFNMPFELGLACNLARYGSRHAVIVLERVRDRLDWTLSDYRGADPLIHGGSCDRLMIRLMDALVVPGAVPDLARMRRLRRHVRSVAEAIKKSTRSRDLLTRLSYLALVDAAIEIAKREGLIRR